jgi:hypothetical protein
VFVIAGWGVCKAPSVQFLSFLDVFECTVSSVADLSEIVFMGDFISLIQLIWWANFVFLMSQ